MPAIVPAAARTVRLFEVFARARREMTNAEIAKLLDIRETSSLDLLHTLQQLGYLLRTPRSRRFYPTPKLLSLARSIAETDPMVAASTEVIELLRDATGETAIAGVLVRHHVEVIGVCEGTHELRFVVPVGRRMGLHVSALGKALLSALEPADLRRQLEGRTLKAVTPHSVTDPRRLMTQLAEARRRGFAETADEGVEGVAAMAVAGRVGEQVLAFSIFGPTDRIRRERSAYRDALLSARDMAFGVSEPA